MGIMVYSSLRVMQDISSTVSIGFEGLGGFGSKVINALTY